MTVLLQQFELAIVIPLLAGLLVLLFRNHASLREASSLLAAVLLFIFTAQLIGSEQQNITHTLLTITPGLSLSFHIEPLGLTFALLASSLWIITTVYSIGYMRGNKEKNQTRFYLFFALSIAATMGIAFAANLATLFIFYEALTLCTFPLVAHKQNADAQSGGRTYLGILLGTSIVFFLTAIVITWLQAGTLNFIPGGILEGNIDKTGAIILFTLFMFGVGKAALMPFHRWLPAAMAAPTPVSALLHAVAVVKAGVFSVLKITIYIFGIDFVSTQNASDWILWIAVATMLISSIIALSKDNFKARLAYSTISQLSYIVIGAALASPLAALGGAMHIVTHAFGKITLFFCAGAIYTATKFTQISQLDGLGRQMPFTFSAYLIAAISIIGLPPLVGSWSKWFLIEGSISTENYIVLIAFGLSTLLNCAYLLPIALRAFFKTPSTEIANWTPGIKEAPLACVAPLCLTALATLIMFFFIQPIYEFLAPVFIQ
ncbi:MAG: monovalent cation/H+ antiporter subunit D family protein [Gammaproteobacteria bacterium]|nr:MAG: monovalent cation/H+ antiporter subunit D family protein [Gammaproteobacteria bacterium]